MNVNAAINVSTGNNNYTWHNLTFCSIMQHHDNCNIVLIQTMKRSFNLHDISICFQSVMKWKCDIINDDFFCKEPQLYFLLVCLWSM